MAMFLTRTGPRATLRPEDLERTIPISINPAEAPFVDQHGYSLGYQTLDTAIARYNNALIPAGGLQVGNYNFPTYSHLSKVGTGADAWLIETRSVAMDPYTYALHKIDPKTGVNLASGPSNNPERQYLEALREAHYPAGSYGGPDSRSTIPDYELPSMLGTGHPSLYMSDYYTNPLRASVGGGPGSTSTGRIKTSGYLDANGPGAMMPNYPAGTGQTTQWKGSVNSLTSRSNGVNLSVGIDRSINLPEDWKPYVSIYKNNEVSFNTPLGWRDARGGHALTSWESKALKSFFW